MYGNHHYVKECLEIFEVDTKISTVNLHVAWL